MCFGVDELSQIKRNKTFLNCVNESFYNDDRKKKQLNSALFKKMIFITSCGNTTESTQNLKNM